MPESRTHMDYVNRIVSYIENSFFKIDISLLAIDSPESEYKPSQVVGLAVPDVCYTTRELSIIGEAKTEHDISNNHTRKQINAYIDYLKLRPREKHLILCSSMYSFPTLKNYCIRYKRSNDINDVIIHVIDDLDREVKI